MASNISDVQIKAAVSQVQTVTRDNVFPVVFETFLMALFTTLIAYFLYQQSSRSSSSRAKTSMLYVAIGSYVLAVVNWAIDIHVLWYELAMVIPEMLAGFDGRDPSYSTIVALEYMQTVLYTCIFSLSDIMLLWRAYILTSRPRWLLYTSIAIIVVEDVFYIVNMMSQLYYFPYLPASTLAVAYQLNAWAAPATFAFTAATQIFASVIIASQIWSSWDDLKDLILFRDSKRQHSQLLLLVVETGVLYSLLWIWATIAITPLSPSAAWDTASVWVPYYLVPISSIYPVAIVVIVSLRHSVFDRDARSESRMKVSFGGLQYGGHTTGSTETQTTSLAVTDVERGVPSLLKADISKPMPAAGNGGSLSLAAKEMFP
ncbi:unnamed protein product [Peniophora sp. CBMAI 1063]|nr:unnamed protein product [Peniophora sp. CBMAI 1063]